MVKNFSFCNSWFLAAQVKKTYSELIPCFRKKVRYKNMTAVSSSVTFHVSFNALLSVTSCCVDTKASLGSDHS